MLFRAALRDEWPCAVALAVWLAITPFLVLVLEAFRG